MFRSANNNDVPAVKEVIFTVLKEYGLKPDPEDTDKDLSNLEEFYFFNGGYFEVCEVDGRIVGTFGLHPLSDTVCELRKMYLLPAERGKGIGKMMMDRALQKARDMNFKKIELETASALKEAISLYQKYGFTPVAKENLVSRCDQTFELAL